MVTLDPGVDNCHGHYIIILIQILFVPRIKEDPLSVPGFYFMYNTFLDVGIRTRVATTAASQVGKRPRAIDTSPIF